MERIFWHLQNVTFSIKIDFSLQSIISRFSEIFRKTSKKPFLMGLLWFKMAALSIQIVSLLKEGLYHLCILEKFSKM